jgi:Calcineurin-like phosphoesterase
MRRLALIVALAVAGCASTEPSPSRVGSTLHTRWIDPDGDGRIQVGGGEPLLSRTDLGRPRAEGRVLARIVQLTDAHVRDEESPARASFLDRLGAPFTSTFRPQEALTTQVLAAAVRSANDARPDAVVEGGDLVDNAQSNEFDWALAMLHGGRATPDSGAPGYTGIQQASDPDPFYYRPDVDAPRLPGLLGRAQRSVISEGLRSRWYPVLGNHDGLVDGEIPPTAATQALATGDRALVRPRSDLQVPRQEARAPGAVATLLAHGLPGQTRHVAPDPRRRELDDAQAVARLRAAASLNGNGRLDYTFEAGSVLCVVLDLERRQGGSGGQVTAAEVGFLKRALARAGSRWVLVFSHQAVPGSLGAIRALALLDADPRVLALVSGHSHVNRITARRTRAGGYWLISTASLADWPQQERVLQLRATAGGGVAIETWMLDTAPGPLADAARRLAYLDAQGGRPQGFAGSPSDRNVRLWRDPVASMCRVSQSCYKLRK